MPTLEEVKAAYERKLAREAGQPVTMKPTVLMPEREGPPVIPPQFRPAPPTLEEVQAAYERKQQTARQKRAQAKVAEADVWQRFGGGLVRPYAELAAGFKDLTGQDPTEEEMEKLAYLREIRGPAAAIGELVTDIGTTIVPAGWVARGARLLTKAPGLTRGALTLGGESALVGGYEAAKLPREGETRAQRGGTAAALTGTAGLALKGIGTGIREGLIPTKFPKTEEAMREQARRRAAGESDFLPMFQAMGENPPTFTGGALGWVQRRLMPSVPGLQRPFLKGVEESDMAFRDTILKESVPEDAWNSIRFTRQRPGADAPIQDTVADIQKFYRQEYGRLLDPQDFQLDQAAKDSLQTVADLMPANKTRRRIAEYLKNASVPGKDIKDLQGRLSEMAGHKSVTPSERELYDEARDMLESSIRAQLSLQGPDSLAQYERLRRPYRNFLTVQKAVAGKPKVQGEFFAEDIAQAGARKKGQAESVAARGGGPLQSLGGQAAKVYRKPERADFYRSAAGIGLGASMFAAPIGTTMMAGPLWGAAPGALSGVLASSAWKTPQRFMLGELDWQPPLKAAAARTERLRERARQAATLGYALEDSE